MHILFLDSQRSAHHDRFENLLNRVGNVVSIYLFEQTDIPQESFDLIVFADLDLTCLQAGNFSAPKIAISWAWDLQKTLRSNPQQEELLKYALSIASLLIVDCDNVCEIALGYGIEFDKIITVPFGIDLDRYKFQPSIREEDGLIRLYSNRKWEPIYRNELILEAVTYLNRNEEKYFLTLANDGTTRKELVGKFYHLFDSNVCKWIGRVSEADNIANLIQSDLYVSTSKSDGSSISLLEAMAIGTPVLITDNSPNREWIIDGKSGYLFSGDSGLELAEKIHITMSSASRPKSLLSTARNTVERRADWHIIEEIITHAIIILIEKQKQ